MKGKIFIIVFCITTMVGCIILSPKNMDNRLKQQSSKDIKSEMHRQLLNNRSDTCNLTGLLRILAKNINKIQNNKFDDRIDKVKDDIVLSYIKFNDKYYYPEFKSLVINESDLEAKMSCYLDYILDTRYEYVSFWEFWKTSYNLQYPCK